MLKDKIYQLGIDAFKVADYDTGFFVLTKRFKKIYRGIYGAKNLLAIWRDKRRLVEINVGHCLPLPNFPISQPASPCARRSRPIEVFVLASSDREMSQLENGIRPLVRDTAALSAIALPGLCAGFPAPTHC